MTYKVQGQPLQAATLTDLCPSTPISSTKIALMAVAFFTGIGTLPSIAFFVNLAWQNYKMRQMQTLSNQILQMGTLLGRTCASQTPGERKIGPLDPAIDWQYEADLRANLIRTNASLPPVTNPKRRIAAEPHDSQIIAAFADELRRHITVHLQDMPAGAAQNNLLLAQAKLHNGTITLQELDEYILEPLNQLKRPLKSSSPSYCFHRIPLIRREITQERVEKGGTPVYAREETRGMFQDYCDKPPGGWTEKTIAEHEQRMKAEERYYISAASPIVSTPKKPRLPHALKAQAAPKTTLTYFENQALEKEELAKRAAAYPNAMNEYGSLADSNSSTVSNKKFEVLHSH